MMDKYQNYAELSSAETEGRDFKVTLKKQSNSRLAIIAPHGGSIEPGTSELSRAIAGIQYSYALFEGIKSSGNQDLHITSSRFDVPEFCQLVSSHSQILALHGEKGREAIVYLGGRNSDFCNCISESLKAAGFEVATHDNPQLQGMSTQNICNRGLTGKGVQLEIAAGLRRKMFESLNKQGRQITTRVFDQFVEAIKFGIEAYFK